MSEHPELRTEAIHNKRADRLADEAREHFFHPNVRRLSEILIERHKQYILFVRAIMAIIGRVHIVSQELRRAQASIGQHPDRSGPTSLVFEPIWNDNSLQYVGLQFKCSQSMLFQFTTQHASAAIVLPFIRGLESLHMFMDHLGLHGLSFSFSPLRLLTTLCLYCGHPRRKRKNR